MEDKSGACIGPERAQPPQEAEALSDLKAASSTTWLDPWRACTCVCKCVCVGVSLESGFGLLGDFIVVAGSVDYLVIDLWEGPRWKEEGGGGGCFNPGTNMDVLGKGASEILPKPNESVFFSEASCLSVSLSVVLR